MSDQKLSWSTINDPKVPVWKVNHLEYGLDGAVHTVHWTCKITRWGTEDNDFVCVNGQIALRNTSKSDDGFIPLEDLTEEIILEWVRAEMLEEWGNIENTVVNKWNNSQWVVKKSTLPWGMTPISDEEEQEPGWVRAAKEVVEPEPTEAETSFEPLEMPEGGEYAEEGDETTSSESGDSETDGEEPTNPPSSGTSVITFGNNLPEEE